MPDMTLRCPQCDCEYKISESVPAGGFPCRTCGAKMAKKPGPEEGSKLSLRRSTPPRILSDWHPDDDNRTGSCPVVHPTPVIEPHDAPRVHHTPKWLAGLVMLVVAGLLTGFQYKADMLQNYMGEYSLARNIFFVATYLFVVLVAFQDRMGSGALCLLFPPYAIVYSITSVESWLLRGALYGVVIGLATEIYLLPESSLFMSAGKEINGVIDSVDAMIVRASGSPVLKN